MHAADERAKMRGVRLLALSTLYSPTPSLADALSDNTSAILPSNRLRGPSPTVGRLFRQPAPRFALDLAFERDAPRLADPAGAGGREHRAAPVVRAGLFRQVDRRQYHSQIIQLLVCRDRSLGRVAGFLGFAFAGLVPARIPHTGRAVEAADGDRQAIVA